MGALAYVCGVVGALALAFWRHWPVLVVGIVAVTTAGVRPGLVVTLPAPLALLALGYAAPRRVGWIAAAGVAAAVAAWCSAAGIQLLVLIGWASVLARWTSARRPDERRNDQRGRPAKRAGARQRAPAHRSRPARLRRPCDLDDQRAVGSSRPLLDSDPAQVKAGAQAIRAASSMPSTS